jgi:hypothetical protein
VTGIWARLGVAVDAAERLHGVGRWCAGALLWGAFAAVCAAPMVCAYWIGRSG